MTKTKIFFWLYVAFDVLFAGAAGGLLPLETSAAAQTTVTATVVDPNGNPYFPGTVVAANVPNSGQPQTSTSPSATTTGGAFSLSLAPDTYTFTLCASPAQLGPTVNLTPKQVCFTSPPIAVSGVSQDVSSQLLPVAAVLGPKLGGGNINSVTGGGFGGVKFSTLAGVVTGSLDNFGCPNPGIWEWQGASFSCVSPPSGFLTSLSCVNGVTCPNSGAITIQLRTDCSANQVLQFVGGVWSCASVGVSPGVPALSVQTNCTGTFCGFSGFTFNPSAAGALPANTMTVPNANITGQLFMPQPWLIQSLGPSGVPTPTGGFQNLQSAFAINQDLHWGNAFNGASTYNDFLEIGGSGAYSALSPNAVLCTDNTSVVNGGPRAVTTGCPQSGGTFANTGVFTNTQMNEYVQSLVNSAVPLTEYRRIFASGFATDGLTSAIAVPVGATVATASAVAGYANTSGGSATATNGGYFQSTCITANSQCYGGQFWGLDVGGIAGNLMGGIKVFLQPQNTPASYGAPLSGVTSSLNSISSGTFTSSNAFNAVVGGSGIWDYGFNSGVGQAVHFGYAGPTCSSGSCSSQTMIFQSMSGGILGNRIAFSTDTASNLVIGFATNFTTSASNITALVPVMVPAGSPALASIVSSGATTNTGLYFPGTSTFAQTSAGNQIWQLGSAGLNVTNSAAIKFSSTSASSGTADTTISRAAPGVVQFNAGNVPGSSGVTLQQANAIPFTATGTITAGSPVKMDTGNANQVVPTVTTDTGAGIVVGVAQNSVTAGQTVFVITTGIASMTFDTNGTGNCSIGNWVIVGTLTNADVQCAAAYPAAGKIIGIAMQAQTTTHTAFNVAVGLR